jgi:hypothetical protein
VQAPTFESDPAWLAAAMDKVDEIEGWCTAIRTEAEARMHNGTGVTGWKLVEGKRPARRWDNPEEAEAMLTTFRLKHEERYVYKAISPTRAEKLATVSAKDAKAGIKPTIGARQWAKLEPLINRGTPKAHVAPASDPRPAIEIKPVEEMFDVVTPDDASDLV